MAIDLSLNAFTTSEIVGSTTRIVVQEGLKLGVITFSIEICGIESLYIIAVSERGARLQ